MTPQRVAMMAALALLSIGCATTVRVEGLEAPPAEPATGTVIVANMGDNTATLIDVATRRVVATLPTGNGAHEVTVSNDGPSGNSLTVIDVPSAKVVRTIELGEFRRPHGSAFLPGDSLLAVTAEMNRAVVLVDFRQGVVAGSIPTNHAASHMLAMTANASRIFTTNVADGTVSELDVGARTFLRDMTVAPQVEGIAVTPGGEQVWVGSNQQKTVTVLDAKTGRSVGTLAGFGLPYRIAITPNGRTAVIADPPNAVVRIVDVPTRRDRATVKIDSAGVTSAAEFPGSPSPEGVVISRDGRMAYVALQGSSRLAMIDLESATVVAYVPTGAGPDGIGYSPFGR